MTNPNTLPTTTLTVVVATANDHPAGLSLKTLTDYLSDRTGISINLRRCKNYKEAITSLTDGSAQIGWLGSYAHNDAVDRGGSVQPFAVGVPKSTSVSNHYSLFIVRPDSNIKMLVDVRNSSIALVNVYSTSGYDVPKRELAEVGIDIDNKGDFKSITHVVDHNEAVLAVLERRVDVAPVSSIYLQEMVASGAIDSSSFRILHQSPAIPGALLVFTLNLESDLKQRIKALVLDAHNHIDISGYGGLMSRYVDPLVSRRKHLETHLRPQWGWRTFAGITAFVSVYVAIMVDLEVNPAQLINDSFLYITDILERMWPPNFSNFGQLMWSMLETVEIAMLGTLLAVLLSIPIGLFSARNISPNYPVYLIARTITVFFRAIPEFIMAMILVIAIGFGAMPGVIALGFHTMGFLAKFYAESIEHINEGPMEALDSMGASRWQVIAFAVAPQILPSFTGNNLYILDRNIRMATMLGIVGAGGIGYELQSSFRMFEYQRVSAIILVIFVTIFVIDRISGYIRKKVA